ncbi:MAG: tRNA epoxyqueuosine(34) reductase QueG [Bacteroidia bacterium]
MTNADQIAISRSKIIKELAYKQGFEFVGISKAEKLESEARHLENWLSKGMHGKMHYMENHFDKRIDPTLLVPGAKSVISLLLNYSTDKTQEDENAPRISKYAFGEDYHFVIKRKLKDLLFDIRTEIGEIDGRVFVDSAPVMDKAWAKKAGLGWIGKHSNLINKQSGSFFFIAELIIDLELAPDGPIKDYCGNCTRCIDACPTEAIIEPYKVDGSKCISYLTIELKNSIDESWKSKMSNWMFGCDICQEVCPWNRFSENHSIQEFSPNTGLLEMKSDEWMELTEEIFQKVFKNSAVKRAGYQKLKSTIHLLKTD